MEPMRDPRETPADLRRAAREGKAARARVVELERTVALLEAGVPIHSHLGRMFDAGYPGPIDVESIAEAWSALTDEALTAAGVAPGSAPVDEYPDDGSTAARSELARGAMPDVPTPDPHPNVVATRQGDAMRAQGFREDDILANAVGLTLAAAAAGDKRVIINDRGRR